MPLLKLNTRKLISDFNHVNDFVILLGEIMYVTHNNEMFVGLNEL